MASLAKRLGFARTKKDNATEDPALAARPRDSGSGSNEYGIEKDPAISSGVELKVPENELEANAQLNALKKKHRWDPNLPAETLAGIEEATHAHDIQQELNLVDALTENSPYPQVRAAVRNYDEDLPANTIRMWVIGMFLTTIGSALNMLFSMRAPQLIISSLVAQLVAYPIGYAWQVVMPSRKFKVFGKTFSLNPGPFNIKEHTVIVVMANCTFGGGAAYATDVLVAQRAFYGQNFGWGFELLVTISTQCIGYGIAGILRKYLVWPAAMIWPWDLVNTSLFYALHDKSKTDPTKTHGWSISRYRYFFYVFIGSFVWYWFPGWIATFLSVFAFPTFIRPNSVIVNQLFGGWTGMSLIPITFDWTQVTGYIQSPLVSPWHAIANTLIGMIVFFWITTLGLHYTNHWYGSYLPISDSNSYDNTGMPYNVSRILTPEFTLDLDAYRSYSPLFLSTTFSLCYGLSFAAIAAVIVHTALFHGPELYERWKSVRSDDEDIHTRMMRKYKEAPNWWYLAIMLSMIAISLAAIYAYDTHLSWWAFFVAILISLVWAVPIGMIQATTNIQLGLNVFTEFLVGYAQPGRPLAMMLFKTYGYITMNQSLAFIQDLKLGHYMKVPPRVMFSGQVVATVWSCFVQVAVFEWALGSISGICTRHQANHYSCPNGRVFFNASVIWGLIGPQRIFSPGNVYSGLLWFWLVGALLPVVIYVAARMFPKTNIRYLSAPIIFGGTGSIPPATPLNYLSWGIVGYVFNKYIMNKYRGWWMRFNYITSAGLDIGLAICTIVIFLCLDLTNQSPPNWWGNTAPANTMDALDTAVQKTVAPGEIFGPLTW